MRSTGRFTPELRRLVYHSYDECGRCGEKISAPAAAYAGYDAAGMPCYVGECCKGTLNELASHIYWSWHADRRCTPRQKLWRYMDLAKFFSLLEDGALFFARADQLGDPFEGAAGIAARQSVWDGHQKAYFRQAMITAPGRSTPLTADQLEKDALRLLDAMRHGLSMTGKALL